jgi:hypothetical protein|tara:strand:+ start:33908 stop:34297 length:390 start_codon:yes stop_codon:yes gene_type:complete
MKIIENEYDGNIVKKVVLDARLLNGLTLDSNPMHLKNEKMTAYHWAEVELLDVNGRATQRGSVIVWDSRLQDNPERYAESKVLPIEITLSGDSIGVAQEHLGNGRFDIESLGISLGDVKEQVIEEGVVI